MQYTVIFAIIFVKGVILMDKMTTDAQDKSLFAEERQRKIIETINANGKAVVPVLCEMFGVSSSTIRNDLKQLEGEKLITRTHGGAIRNSKMGRELPPTDKETQMMPQKRAIARAALDLIDDGDIIAMTTGTTTYELIKLLPGKKNLTVIVNDIRHAAWLEEHTEFNVYILGGMVRRRYHYTTLPTGNEFLGKINIDKGFFSCNGFSIEKGITAPDFETAKSVREILDACCASYLMSDSSKLGTVTFAQIADLRYVNGLIVDTDIEKEDYDSIAAVTEIITADWKETMETEATQG